MVKKKTEETVVPDEKDEGYTNEELHNESIESIAAGGEGKKTEAVEDGEKAPVETKQAVPEKKEYKPPIDPEAFSETVSEKAAQKLIERMAGVKDKKKETDEDLISPWKKEGRTPKDYEEIADWALQKKSILDARKQKEDEEKQTQQTKAEQDAAETYKKQYNASIDEQLDALYTAGKLPKVKDEKNEHDPGVISRKALFQSMLDWVQEIEKENVTRVQAGQSPLPYPTLKEVFYERYKNPLQPPAGGNAPISFGQGQQVQQEEGSYSYADLKKPWETILGG